MNASLAKVNGTKPPALPIFGDWQPISTVGNATTWEKQPIVPLPAVEPVPARSAVTEAEADAIRIKAEAEAEAVRTKAVEEAERARLANQRAAMRLEREKAEHAAKIAEFDQQREATERNAAVAREQADAIEQDTKAEHDRRAKSAHSWRRAALGFALACAIVALPVQMSAFYNRHALWLLLAPIVLESLAWVVLRGAAAAVDDSRPHWHYRCIAWGAAFIAAGINLSHGLSHFDAATAIGTAFASLAGPGVWDLHEHGRIRVRDGKPSRSQRRAARSAEKAEARLAAREKVRRAAVDRDRAEEQRAAAAQLAADRAEEFPEEWKHASRLASALGEATVTEAVWRRAWDDLHADEPGVTVDTIRRRNVAARRVAAARSEAPGNTPSKVTNAQRGVQVKAPSTRSSYRPVPPRRKAGDTPKFHPAARALAAEAKRQANDSKGV